MWSVAKRRNEERIGLMSIFAQLICFFTASTDETGVELVERQRFRTGVPAGHPARRRLQGHPLHERRLSLPQHLHAHRALHCLSSFIWTLLLTFCRLDGADGGGAGEVSGHLLHPRRRVRARRVQHLPRPHVGRRRRRRRRHRQLPHRRPRYHPVTECSLALPSFYPILPSFTGFYLVLPTFTWLDVDSAGL